MCRNLACDLDLLGLHGIFRIFGFNLPARKQSHSHAPAPVLSILRHELSQLASRTTIISFCLQCSTNFVDQPRSRIYVRAPDHAARIFRELEPTHILDTTAQTAYPLLLCSR
jgi:hypothetical protein